MHIDLDGVNFYGRFDKLAQALHANATTNHNEIHLSFNNEIGSGTIQGMRFSNGLEIIISSLKTHKQLSISREPGFKVPLVLYFVNKGTVDISQPNDKNPWVIHEGKAVLCVPGHDGLLTKTFMNNTDVEIISISIRRALFLDSILAESDVIPEKLAMVLSNLDPNKGYYHIVENSPSLNTCIKDIIFHSETGLSHNTFMMAKSIELFSRFVAVFSDKAADASGLHLYNYDLRQIVKAKQIICENLADPPVIEELSKIVGLNATKLQRGFKLVYKRTINKLLQYERMQKAQQLLETNEYQVGQISSLVGYANKGRFSQLFKEEFGVLPKDYRKALKNQQVG